MGFEESETRVVPSVLIFILTLSDGLIDIYDKEVEVLVTQLQERIEALSGTFLKKFDQTAVWVTLSTFCLLFPLPPSSTLQTSSPSCLPSFSFCHPSCSWSLKGGNLKKSQRERAREGRIGAFFSTNYFGPHNALFFLSTFHFSILQLECAISPIFVQIGPLTSLLS